MSIPLIGVFVRILRVRATILAPLTVLITLVGVYTVRLSVFDMFAVVAFGVVGYLMKKAGWSRVRSCSPSCSASSSRRNRGGDAQTDAPHRLRPSQARYPSAGVSRVILIGEGRHGPEESCQASQGGSRLFFAAAASQHVAPLAGGVTRDDLPLMLAVCVRVRDDAGAEVEVHLYAAAADIVALLARCCGRGESLAGFAARRDLAAIATSGKTRET